MTAAEKLKNKQATASTMLDAIIALKPQFRERAAQAKSERRVPAQSISDLQQAGFFLALQPQEWGGA